MPRKYIFIRENSLKPLKKPLIKPLIKSLKKDNPNANANAKKVYFQGEESKYLDKELKKERDIMGASRYSIKPTEKEWEAIQAGIMSVVDQKEILDSLATIP